MDINFNFLTCQSGDTIPPITWGPITNLQLVKWAAGSGDFNPIHFDLNTAHKQGLDNVLVHGPYKYALVSKILTNLLGQKGHIIKLSATYTGMDVAGNSLTFLGTIVNTQDTADGKIIDLSYTLINQNEQTTVKGKAAVVAK